MRGVARLPQLFFGCFFCCLWRVLYGVLWSIIRLPSTADAVRSRLCVCVCVWDGGVLLMLSDGEGEFAVFLAVKHLFWR